MNIDSIIQWLLIFVPLALSPGPANILFAASGSSFGVKGSLPFWLGTNIVCIFQILFVGFGLGYVISAYPLFIEILKYIGILFLLYLAFKFFKMSVKKIEKIEPLSFKNGLIVEFLNVKFLIIPIIMFSQFYSAKNDSVTQFIILTISLSLLTMISNLIWILGGKVLISFVTSSNVQKVQGTIFGLMLCLTALWLAIG
ncbi:Lysine exporter protein (LYSE/YGGA) [Arcobacter nitrofigilis DSM 7299]|uniref:Lysine exporter protein (LYSE/YGGA) n=1 Tax=Arcobacter nitrofigilis (strain ATCC 33309 / DSM 7299 / CCUG 15893 / LMG 7604 / NCTC 12251 / CI) TaxID=572480 RepID=D5V0F2_ARCNC|nr:LysE family translocator [Arcobacter nitrofigilis]ADG93764.1 Lysine exporter protein (LYSE/YGGA) [Arcobacter nitrofigilis DSM 7299]